MCTTNTADRPFLMSASCQVTSRRVLEYLNSFIVDVDVRRPGDRVCLGWSAELGAYSTKLSGVDSLV
jgi:hypothetical protein